VELYALSTFSNPERGILYSCETLLLACELHQVKYLNHLNEQDHRFIKRRTKYGLGSFSFETAQRALARYETMTMIRKGQPKGAQKGDMLAQVKLINCLFGSPPNCSNSPIQAASFPKPPTFCDRAFYTKVLCFGIIKDLQYIFSHVNLIKRCQH